MISVEPSVSTDAIFLIITFLFAIVLIPSDNIIVIIELIPSGIAATANDIDSIRISKKSFFIHKPNPIITSIIASII